MQVRSIQHVASLVKISHTVFALPFALAAVALAAPLGAVSTWRVALIILCITAARTAAMAFNRLVDRHIDGANPRTAMREIPAGLLSVNVVRGLVLVSCLVFLGGAALLGPLPLMLSPIALLLCLGYSYTKRFTSFCHLVLGAAIALAPGGAWVAVGAPVQVATWLLVLGVACWVGGFDILYALQDEGYDRGVGLNSIPVRFGTVGSLVLSALLHVGTVVCLALVGLQLERGIAYFGGILLVAGLLFYEHWLVRPGDLAKIDKAFFDLNGYVSLGFFLCVLLDQFLRV